MKLGSKCITVILGLAALAGLTVATSLPVAAVSTSAFRDPVAIALDHAGHLWVVNNGKLGVTELDASTGSVLRVINAKADDFNGAVGVAVLGNYVWVLSSGFEYHNGTTSAGTVTELNAITGSLVRVINLKAHGVTGLSGVSADPRHVWVTADGGAQVVELSNSSGSVVHFYRLGKNLSANGTGIITTGTRVWIPSPSVSLGVVERSAVTGDWIRTIIPTMREVPPGGGPKAPTYLGPHFVTADAHYVWTANGGGTPSTKLLGGSVTQIEPATGAIIRDIGTKADRFQNIKGIVSDGTHVWVVNGSDYYSNGRRGNSITELNASTGSLVRVIELHQGIYSSPSGLVSNGTDVWVVDQGGGVSGTGCVIELKASTGAVVRVIGA